MTARVGGRRSTEKQCTEADVIRPPASDATTARPSARADSNSAGRHSVRVLGLLCSEIRLCHRRTLPN